jgi:transposase
MRPYGTAKQLAARRRRALALLRGGASRRQVAGQVGVTTRSLRRWRAVARQPKRPAAKLGRPARLADSQMRCLVQMLKRGACAQGHVEDYWTLARVARLIRKRFGADYHPSGVWHLLRRLDWSCQRPQRRTFARDEEAIAHWKRYVWPQIKKVARSGCNLDFCRRKRLFFALPAETHLGTLRTNADRAD